MSNILILLIFIVLCFLSSGFRCFLCNIHKVIFYGIRDIFFYIKHKRWRECKDYGKINCYTGLFGRGKTLSGVHKVLSIYNRYNGKMVWSEQHKCYKQQTIRIISNVDLAIPHIKLTNTQQIINASEGLNDVSVAIVLIDEASTQFNSRNFKNNISATLLNSMLTCRHHKFGMILTSQRFLHMDALIRQICEDAIECKKIWRFQFLYRASAWDLENCTNINLVKHVTSCWFVSDKDYKAYDTLANVENIKRMQQNGELLTDEEILARQGNINTSEYNVNSRKMRKLLK